MTRSRLYETMPGARRDDDATECRVGDTGETRAALSAWNLQAAKVARRANEITTRTPRYTGTTPAQIQARLQAALERKPQDYRPEALERLLRDVRR